MWIYLSVVAASTFVAVQVEKNKGKQAAKIGFFLLFVILFLTAALRYDTGIDYWNYISIYKRFQIGIDTHVEPGFAFLMQIISDGGFSPQWMFIVTSFFTVLFFLKALYEQSSNFALSIFLYQVMGYYFYSFNSIRYYLAVSIAFYSLKYVVKRKYIPFIVWVLIAANFHKSVLIVLMFYPFANMIKLDNQGKGIAFFLYTQAIGAFSYLIRGTLRKWIFYFYESYEGSRYDDGDVSALNILLCIGTIALMLIYYDRFVKNKEARESNQFYYKMICMGLALYMYGSWIPETSRIGYYLIIVLPVVLPRIISVEPNVKYRCFLTYCCCAMLGLLFIYSLLKVYPDNGTGVGVALLPYHVSEFNWIFN